MVLGRKSYSKILALHSRQELCYLVPFFSNYQIYFLLLSAETTSLQFKFYINMMKHILIFSVISLLMLAGCQRKAQNNVEFTPSDSMGESYTLPDEDAEEVIITGKVLNRDFYPNEKELTLIIPFFHRMENEYRTPIQEDGSFYFIFPVYAKIREVSIRNYAEHLYVHPNDSLHIEIDFKDMFHPKVTGDAEKLNQEILAFTESGYYYMRDYGIGYDKEVEDFEAVLKKEYQLRRERRKEYIQKYKPSEDVRLFTEELLKQDYYYALMVYATQYHAKIRKQIPRYRTLMPEINKLYERGILSARLFDVADWTEQYMLYEVFLGNKKRPTIEDVMTETGEKNLNQYLYTHAIANTLQANDIASLEKQRSRFDSIVKFPHLRAQITQMYRQTKAFLDNPQSVSDNMLYGKYNESSRMKTSMPYMEKIYKILEENLGKVIYLDFWAVWCPPCLAEMEPLKELRGKYPAKDLAIYSLCGGGGSTKEAWQKCIDKYALRNCGIECHFIDDYIGEENYYKIKKQWKMNKSPYYVLINRKGQIVDYGTAARPSNPRLLEKIEELIRQEDR